MYRILLIFSAITLVCSVAEARLDEKTQQTVNEICKQTIDTKFCRAVFVKNLMTSSPSKNDLLNVTVTEAERFSGNTCFFISTLLRNAGDERADLQMCAEAYAIVDTAFTKALSFFSQGLYDKILNLEENVSNGIGICKTDFSVSGYEINPLIEKNRETMVLMAMEKIVGHMASS
ncbi:hypothetical protein EUTSA_v10009653mg [Eutrema salsugineum]|uniref:Pectinesterase inhibitor domain-containing protein n=2 Tax=Eutrema salsugineum TaxID=72664 RepID=V4L0T7_EUTSA|nr:hypothetical protein EUTSA_v10009653mg [Eutrema salsugineum]